MTLPPALPSEMERPNPVHLIHVAVAQRLAKQPSVPYGHSTTAGVIYGILNLACNILPAQGKMHGRMDGARVRS